MSASTEQTLKITVQKEGEAGVRTKTYTDYEAFLSDLRDWQSYADNHDLRYEEKTHAQVSLGEKEGPLFS